MLRSVDWQLVADVSGQLVGPIFKGQTVMECLTSEDGTNVLSQNLGNQPPMYAA
jgi:hypothetical protein